MRNFVLSESFLAPYFAKRDMFPDLLARSVYLSKYSRRKADGTNESWTDTIRRVVEGSISRDKNATTEEAEALFDVFWTMQALPPGRGLWVGGVEGIPAEAQYNCYYTNIDTVDDWGWLANMLMMGGGVGVGLANIHNLPVVQRGEDPVLHVFCASTHADVLEVHPDAAVPVKTNYVEDSRQGWVNALVTTIKAAFAGNSIAHDVSGVRRRGSYIKTFGGIACGPGPLVDLLRSVWKIVRAAAGRTLTSVECLDITNFTGKCIKAGNVRRSALIQLGNPLDEDFRNAKKDWAAVTSHRHTSNNSLFFEKFSQFDHFDWGQLARDNAEFGEPGIVNAALARLTDPGVVGINPCGEQFLYNKEACNLVEYFPAKFNGRYSAKQVIKLITRYAIRQRLSDMEDVAADEIGKRNMRIGVGLGGICDFLWEPSLLRGWFKHCVEAADSYADELGVPRPITKTTTKPSGTISLLNHSAPGLHADFDDFYLRNIRLDRDEPMAAALTEAGVPSEPDVYDNKGRTLVFGFPMKLESPMGTSVKNQTLREQFQRQLLIQDNWADNAVSSTISFDKNDLGSLEENLRHYAPKLKSVSCLPSEHGYVQAPYMSITEEAYVALSSQINNAHPLTTLNAGLDALQVEECSGGICPVR